MLNEDDVLPLLNRISLTLDRDGLAGICSAQSSRAHCQFSRSAQRFPSNTTVNDEPFAIGWARSLARNCLIAA